MFSRSFASAGLRQAAAATNTIRPAAFRSASTLIARPAAAVSISAPSFRRASPQLIARRYLSDTTKQAISAAVSSAPVVLFMKGTPEMPQCGFSRASIQVLGLQGVDPAKFAAFNVLEDDELRSGIKEFSDWPTIPQLYLGGEFVGGCDILMSMHQDGSLAKMLEEQGVLVVGEGGGADKSS